MKCLKLLLKKKKKTKLFIGMKKVIRITESDFHKIVKRILTEKMGVPDNITQTGVQIYDALIHQLNSREYDESDGDYEITIDNIFKIGDYEFDEVLITLRTGEHIDPTSEPKLASCTVALPNIPGKKFFIKGNVDLSTVRIMMIFAVGKEWNLDSIINAMINDRPNILSVLTHELKHAYDKFIQPTHSFHSRSSYESAQQMKFKGIDPINEFFFFLYYIHEIESSVRSSEFYADLKANNITKKDFKDFFNKSRMIENLKNIKNFKFSDLVAKLHNHIPDIEEFFTYVEDKGQIIQRGDTDDEKVNNFLNLIFRYTINGRINTYSDILKHSIDPFRMMFAQMTNHPDEEIENKEKMVEEFAKRAQKYKNYQDFFGNEQKIINFAADKLIRKLSKLYDMAQNNINEGDSSIVDWELYHAINKTEEKTIESVKKFLREKSEGVKDNSFIKDPEQDNPIS